MTQIPKPRLQLRAWRLPALVLLLLILHLFIPYRGWQVLLIGLGGAWLLSYLWARSLARNLQLTRELRFGWAQVGDRMVERFRLTNTGWAPASWVEVLDQSTLPDYPASRGTSVPARGSSRWHVEAVCTRRGLFTLGPTRMQTGDPFGLYTVSIDYPAFMPLLVLPPTVPLPAIEVEPGGRTGQGRPRADAPERTVSAAGVREYQPGDTPRWIHWRTSARQDALFVRLFDGAPASDWWIVLDVDRHVQEGEGADSTEEHAVILAASLADRGLQTGQSVGLAAHGEQLVWLAPRGGAGRRWEILHALALVSPGSRSLADLLKGMREAFGRHTSLVVITPSRSAEWIEALVPILRTGATPTVLWLDPVSFGAVGSAGVVPALLADLGIAHYVITRDLLDRPEARPGQRWRWGRTVEADRPASARQAPAVGWRPLSS